MPRADVSARPARRSAAPWWEELEREAFRFPAAREVRPREGRAREVRAAERPKRPAPTPEAPAPVSPLPAPASVSRAGGGPGSAGGDRRSAGGGPRSASGDRRTVTIRGYGAERDLPVARPTLRRYERPGFRPDRVALWAVLLGLCLIVVAAASAHGAVLH
ncbi:MAG: hypothetical protein JO286_09545 [Solirubrobacterales bacterium]|nr:hypothetical protein [Solirubrobacterales bacterium]MBV9363919.1 hypothetical protein [Solirubrobacterales bacterium]MBV9684081.1 hypothetical protein [Solirubrobacterales bacterium]MBV9807412.1 hypothetical protein [Solirubrobacterales bacterium]